ncbi:DUF6624 domain-containing protein [Actinoplanes sp. NPDC026619]|uniref:DUF6624 domain-containing protein n=1 Tax=Actinoplanes sp. NPDC026619 TaxID=3155798 RepID=UPI0033D731E3
MTHTLDLPAVARREQALLAAALASLFTDPALDARISQALGYPHWPQPLTLLPDLAPHLTVATPQLAAYLAFATTAGRASIDAVVDRGWPSQPADADAAWILLQHADADNDRRRTVLTRVADAVHRGATDPRHLALLTDRERAIRGLPQTYGTLRLIRDEQPVLLYPLDGSPADVDDARQAIGLPSLETDARFAFSPLTPYGTARTSPTNPWRPGALDPLRPEAGVTVTVDHPGPLPAGTVGVYLAATLRYRNQTCRIREALPAPLISTSRWLDIDPLTRASCQLDAGLALNQLAARLCLADVTRADTMIAFEGQRRSHGLGVEIGVALAHHKHVIIIGLPRCSFDTLADVTLVDDLDEALEVAVTYGQGKMREPA